MEGLDTTMKARMGEMKRGLKYGAHLLKSTMREVASSVPSPVPSSGSRASRPAEEFGDGPAVVHYHVQGPKDVVTEDSDNCFLIAQQERDNGVTKGLVQKLFPVKGNFLLRFKTFDSTFGHIWADLPLDTDAVPLYMGQIEVKVVRLPDAVAPRTPQPSARAPSSQSKHTARQEDTSGSTRGGGIEPIPDLLFGEGPKQLRPTSPSRTVGGTVPVTTDNYTKLETREEIRKRNEDMVQGKARAAADLVAARATAEGEAIAAKLSAAEVLSPLLDKWAFNSDGSLKDCRTLLGTIPDVMWAECTFTPTPIPEMMLSSAKVKRAYRSCIIVFHPDKHQGSEADIVYRAERIFQHVNDAWDVMRKKEAQNS